MAKPKASLALVDADAAPAATLSTLRLRPSERRTAKAEPAPVVALGESRAPGLDMFFGKGDASASTFKPSYWTYERHPDGEAPRAVAPAPAAELTPNRPAKRPPPQPQAQPQPPAPLSQAAASAESPVVAKAPAPARPPMVAGAAAAPMGSLTNLGFLGKSKAPRVMSADAAKVAEALLAREAALRADEFEEVDPPLETTADYIAPPVEAPAPPPPVARETPSVAPRPRASPAKKPAPKTPVATPPAAVEVPAATAPEKPSAVAKAAPPIATTASEARANPVPPVASPAPPAEIAAPSQAEPSAAAPRAEKSQSEIARSVINELRGRFRRMQAEGPPAVPETPTVETPAAGLPEPAILQPATPPPPAAPAPPPSEIEPHAAPRARSTVLPALPELAVEPPAEIELPRARNTVLPALPELAVEPPAEIEPPRARSTVLPALPELAVEPPAEIEPPRARSTIQPALPELAVEPPAEIERSRARTTIQPALPELKAEPAAAAPSAPPPAPIVSRPSPMALEIEIDAAAEERRVAAEIADTLGSAIEGVLASKWYGTGEWQGAPPPEPVMEQAASAPAITHDGLMAELAAAREASNPSPPPRKRQHGNRGIIIVCVLMLALGTFFALSLWRNHANPFATVSLPALR